MRRELSKITGGKKPETWSVKTRESVNAYLQSFTVDPLVVHCMDQQLLIFHMQLAELLEDLSENALQVSLFVIGTCCCILTILNESRRSRHP